jgi:hypothetical protein
MLVGGKMIIKKALAPDIIPPMEKCKCNLVNGMEMF